MMLAPHRRLLNTTPSAAPPPRTMARHLRVDEHSLCEAQGPVSVLAFAAAPAAPSTATLPPQRVLQATLQLL